MNASRPPQPTFLEPFCFWLLESAPTAWSRRRFESKKGSEKGGARGSGKGRDLLNCSLVA